MSDTTELPVDPDLERAAGAETTAAEEALGESLLRKAQKARHERDDVLYLDIPSWDGDIVGAYRVLDRTTMERLIRKITKESKNGNSSANLRTKADIDLIVRACVGLYARNPDSDAEEGSHDDLVQLKVGDEPATYGSINELLKSDQIRDTNSAVMYLFAKDGGDAGVAISAHALTIARYMQDPSKDPTDLE